MKYILKYKTKSRYFGFVRENYKEFDEMFRIFYFIETNQVIGWKIYEQKDYLSIDLMERENK